jgi:hypothetical protein
MSRGGKAAYGHERKPKTEIDGIKFMSPGEAERYIELCILKLKGEIQSFELQPKFEIQPKFRKLEILFRPIMYIADFKIFYSPSDVRIEDVKGWGGYTTPEFKLKRKLFEYKYPELTLILLKCAGKPKRIAELLAEREALKNA